MYLDVLPKSSAALFRSSIQEVPPKSSSTKALLAWLVPDIPSAGNVLYLPPGREKKIKFQTILKLSLRFKSETALMKHNSLRVRTSGTYQPKLDEVLQIRGRDEEAVEQRVREEQHEVLVVGESHAVVHPGGKRRKWRDRRGKGATNSFIIGSARFWCYNQLNNLNFHGHF